MIDKGIYQYNICNFESLGSSFYERIDSFYTTIIGVRELLARYSNDSLFDCLVKLQYRLKKV